MDPQPNDFISGESYANPDHAAPMADEPSEGPPVRASFSQSHGSLADRIRESSAREGFDDDPGEPAA